MNWAQRYANNNLENSNQQQPAAQNSIGSHLTQLYNMIWPEGPKTMASDVSNISKMTIDPQKRDNAKAVVQSIIPYVKQKGKELKNKLQGRDEDGLDEDGLMKPVASKSWNSRYIKEAALDDTYKQLFEKFKGETAFTAPTDPRRQAWKEYTSTPLKDGTVRDRDYWSNSDHINPNDLDHPALMRVCDKWSPIIARATGGDSNSGESYHWPVANHIAEMKDYHQSQFQPTLNDAVFSPPPHREQLTRKRRNQ